MRSLRTFVLSFVPLVLAFPLLPQQTLTNVTHSSSLALTPTPQRDPQAATAQQPRATHHLTLIGQNDPEFSSLIATNFPGLDQLNGYATYRPFLVLLRNDTPHAIRAYMLRWEARSLDGAPFRLQDLIDRNDPGLASGRVALAPGEMRLVSDHFRCQLQGIPIHASAQLGRNYAFHGSNERPVSIRGPELHYGFSRRRRLR